MTLTLHPARKAGRVLTFLALTGLCAAALPASAGITTLASFTGNDGSAPFAGVTFDSSGNLFGTTLYGGASGQGTVYEIAKGSSTLTTLASFTGNGVGNNGSDPTAGVTFDSSGNLFGTTTGGGTSGFGTVYEIAKVTGTLTTLASFTGANGSGPYAGVTFDSSGNLFGTTGYKGGTSNGGTVYEIAQGSSTLTTLASFTGANGSGPRSGVTFDSSGNLFGTTAFQGGTSNGGTVYEIAQGSSSLTTLASFTGANGSLPYGGVTFDSSGNLFGTTFNGGTSGYGTVYEIAKGSSTLTTLASFTGANGENPYAGVTFDSSGNLFGTTYLGGASNYGTVYEIAKGSSTLTTLASFTGANGRTPNAGVTFDSSGNLFGTTFSGGTSSYGTVYEIAGAGSPVPESSTVISFATLLGLGSFLLRARKRRQNATPGV